VFFYLIFHDMQGIVTSSIGYILNFFSLSVGGALIGIIFGIIGNFWVSQIIRDEILTSILTLTFTYILFFVA